MTAPGLPCRGPARPGTSKVNLVRIPSTASSPRDTALAAVICSALATVLLALLVLCVIYCKRQFVEKKPSLSNEDLRGASGCGHGDREHVQVVLPGEALRASPGEPVSLTEFSASAGSLRAQDLQYNGSELSCFDRPRLSSPAPRACCQCLRDSAQTCDTTDLSRLSDALLEPVRAQIVLTAENQLHQGRGDAPHLTTQPHAQC
ncbi:TNFRSF19 [Cervus elaphus hippelaphus]|uniref:TNFRSF19 n=1 Tax=Cervus elaphus hippelaphus TaxID=46360 RepID=A0A212C470_CEREH|nr:TNFRSF19 [Cervus elaphus hippelaphus]